MTNLPIIHPSAAHRREKRAGKLQIAATFIGVIFIVTLVLYALNTQRDESGGQQSAAVIQMNPQPGPQSGQPQDRQQNQPQSNQQPAAASPDSAKPPSNNASSTTGQGGGGEGNPVHDAGDNATSPAPADTPTRTAPDKAGGNQ